MVLLVREEPTVREAQREAGECLVWLGHLELLADRVYLAEQVTLESQARRADLGDPILRTTSERFALLCSEVGLIIHEGPPPTHRWFLNSNN